MFDDCLFCAFWVSGSCICPERFVVAYCPLQEVSSE